MGFGVNGDRAAGAQADMQGVFGADREAASAERAFGAGDAAFFCHGLEVDDLGFGADDGAVAAVRTTGVVKRHFKG